MKKLILLIIVIAVIAVGWLLYFNNGDTALKVNLSEARYMDLGNSLEFSGKVVPEKMYSVMSETGGTIKDIYVSEGSKVNIGDPLFDLDTTQVENMLEEARLNYNILKESDAQAVMSQGTGRSLMEERIKIALALSQTTGYDFESFNNAFSDSLSENTAAMASSLKDMSLKDMIVSDSNENDNLALAELAVKKLQDQLDSMYYKSLMEGTVISININEGEVLSPGMPAIVIADIDNTHIEGYIYEKDLHSISKNMRVKIITEDTTYMGKVASLGKAAAELGEQSNYGAMAKIQITPAGSLNKIPGATVDLEIAIKTKENALAIPIECLAGGGYVYVVGKDDILEKRTVETGFKDTFYVEILSGLGEGERVVLTPKNFKEGEKVTYDRN
jgi:multidrug efflux pump subunit AcrA (membrane-fusion protein)